MMAALLTAATFAWTLDSGARIAASTACEPPKRSAAITPHSSQSVSHSILDLPKVEQWSTDAGLSERHLLNVYRHIFRRGGACTADELHHRAELPKKSATALCDRFAGTTSTVVERVASEGGMKLVVQLASGARVETVLILHDHKSSGRRRCTVCVSSQVGCSRGCTFCATGTMGLRAQLSSAEILEQVWHAKKEVADAGYEVRNVVFMGMGEPLDNYDALLGALRGLTHQALFDLAATKITVSTVGASPHLIKQLAHDAPRVRLALSLHGANQALRETLVPSAAGARLPQLIDALDHHAATTGAGVMLEYLLLKDVNDRTSDADELARFCLERNAAAPSGRAGGGAYINLIPFNPTEAGSLRGYETPSDEAVMAFHARLRDVHGVNALVRWKSAVGRDASGACGQLVV